jgi:hypothetical protein
MFVPPSIKTFLDFDQRLSRAIYAIDQLLLKMPGDSTLENLQRQLETAFLRTRQGNRPSDHDLARFNFGMVASRELSDIDPALTKELAALNYYLDVWPAGVRSPSWP